MTQETEQPAAAPINQPQQSPAQQASNAFAQSQVEAERLHLTETVNGGRYEVNGVIVDANGNPIKDKGK